MTPAFSSWQAFFEMGGYGFFVWLAASVAVLSLCSLIVHTLFQRKRLLTEIKRRQQREQRIEQAKLMKEGNV
jgi:heme exporter protein D